MLFFLFGEDILGAIWSFEGFVFFFFVALCFVMTDE